MAVAKGGEGGVALAVQRWGLLERDREASPAPPIGYSYSRPRRTSVLGLPTRLRGSDRGTRDGGSPPLL